MHLESASSILPRSTISLWILVNKRFFTNSLIRLVPNRKMEDNVLLADALNLLSPDEKPKDQVNAVPKYKPSLLANLGSSKVPDEIWKKSQFKVPILKSKQSVNDHVNHLLAGINFASKPKISHNNINSEIMSEKDIIKHIKKLSSEASILEFFDSLYYQNKITSNIMIEFLLNKYLISLKKLPFQVEKISNEDLHFQNWTDLDITKVQIVLLKKYYDLKQPLMIVNNLKKNFESRYLPSISRGELVPFYERIAWKFYFDYTAELTSDLNEEYYIAKIDKLSTSFLIWESSVSKSCDIIKFALQNHQSELNFLQEIFLKLCANEITISVINDELNQSILNEDAIISSKTLSQLKKLSIKYKIYNFPDIEKAESIPIETRSTLYVFINKIESIILDELLKKQGNVDSDAIKELVVLLQELKLFKEKQLMNLEEDPDLNTADWSKLFLAINKWKKT